MPNSSSNLQPNSGAVSTGGCVAIRSRLKHCRLKQHASHSPPPPGAALPAWTTKQQCNNIPPTCSTARMCSLSSTSSHRKRSSVRCCAALRAQPSLLASSAAAVAMPGVMTRPGWLPAAVSAARRNQAEGSSGKPAALSMVMGTGPGWPAVVTAARIHHNKQSTHLLMTKIRWMHSWW